MELLKDLILPIANWGTRARAFNFKSGNKFMAYGGINLLN